jgi:hypothetical protein
MVTQDDGADTPIHDWKTATWRCIRSPRNSGHHGCPPCSGMASAWPTGSGFLLQRPKDVARWAPGGPPPPPPPLFLILLSLSVHGGAFMALAHDLWRGGRPWFYTRSKGRQLSCNHPKRPWPRRLRARAELVTRRRRRSCMPRSTRQRQRTRTREGQGG